MAPGEPTDVTVAPPPPRPAIAWTPRHLLLGATFAVPAVVVATIDPVRGVACALGVLPAAALGLLPTRRSRISYLLASTMAGLGILLGAVLGQTLALALVAIVTACVIGAVAAGRSAVGAAILTLGVPMIGIGFSFDTASSGFVLAAIMAAGGLWCTLVSLPWPARPPRPPAPPQPTTRLIGYGIRLGLAAGIATALGFALQLDHVGWAVGAVLLVMRPNGGVVVARAFGRAGAVIAGAALGGAFMVLTPPGWLMGVVALGLISVLTALAGSRWYITGFFGTFLVFMLLLQGDPQDVAHRFWERAVETLVGVSLALIFGVLVPWAMGRMRSRS